MATCACGAEIVPPDPESQIVAAGGWCAPSETLHDMPKSEPTCSDCNTRMLMLMTIGIDPGKDGENLRVRRGGIQYPKANPHVVD